MATAVKNGSTKKATMANAQLKEKLAEEATETVSKATPQPPKEAVITLDERIAKFKKLQGLNNQRDRLVSTLESLQTLISTKTSHLHFCLEILRDWNLRQTIRI